MISIIAYWEFVKRWKIGYKKAAVLWENGGRRSLAV